MKTKKMSNNLEIKKLKKLRKPLSKKLYLSIAILIFIIFVFFIFRHISNLKGKIPKEGDFLNVVIAKQKIPVSTVIDEEMITIKEILKKYILENAVLDKSLILGKVARYPIYRGEQILISKINDSSTDLIAFPENIPSGNRVITLPIDNQSLIPPTVKYGDKVDVIAVFHTNNINKDNENLSNTRLIAPAKIVLDINNSISTSKELKGKNGEKESNSDFNFLDVDISNSQRWITLLVLPEEVIEISNAMANGKLFFSLCPSKNY
jgi:Flp pilus assembly protein CpaB